MFLLNSTVKIQMDEIIFISVNFELLANSSDSVFFVIPKFEMFAKWNEMRNIFDLSKHFEENYLSRGKKYTLLGEKIFSRDQFHQEKLFHDNEINLDH